MPHAACRSTTYCTSAIALDLRHPRPGRPYDVFIRTNLNQAARIRRQIIDRVEKRQSSSSDFYDIPARYDAATDRYTADILLNDIGCFQLKVRVQGTIDGRPWVRWAPGDDVGITVTPLDYCKSNPVYCAFIRQFDRDKVRETRTDAVFESQARDLERHGAAVLRPTGTFRNSPRPCRLLLTIWA